MGRTLITDLDKVKSVRLMGVRKNNPAEAKRASLGGEKRTDLLWQAQAYYDALSEFRRRRARARRYVEGDQWSELIPNTKNRLSRTYIKEEDFIKQDGRMAFKQNILSQLVNNIVGQYRKNPNKSNVMARARERQRVSEMLSNALQYALKLNETDELDAANLREFIVSGFCAGKVTYEWNSDRQMPEVCIRNRNPNYMFFNTPLSDPRIEPELNMIGEFYDMTLDDVVSALANTKADEERIRACYGNRGASPLETTTAEGLTSKHVDSLSFLVGPDPTKCRVFEIWTYEKEWVTYIQDYLNGSYTRTYYTEKQVQALNRQRVEAAAREGIPLEEVDRKSVV